MKEFNIIEAVEYLTKHSHSNISFFRKDRGDIILKTENGEIHSSCRDGENDFFICTDFSEKWILEEQPKLVSIDVDKTIKEIKEKKYTNRIINDFKFTEKQCYKSGLDDAIQIIKDNIHEQGKKEIS